MFIHIFMYGVSSYLFVWIVLYTLKYYGLTYFSDDLLNIQFLNPSKLEKDSVNVTQIILGVIGALFISIICVVNVNTSALIHFCRFIGLTRRFSDPDVWSLLMNSNDTDNYVTFRKKDEGVIYQGYLQAFSGMTEERELLLTSVKIYDDETITERAEVSYMYFAFKRDDVILEMGRRNADQTPAKEKRDEQAANPAE